MVDFDFECGALALIRLVISSNTCIYAAMKGSGFLYDATD